MSPFYVRVTIVGFVLMVGTRTIEAQTIGLHGQTVSADAVELGVLAPPAPNLATLNQTYGDAAIARARVQYRYARAVRSAHEGLAPVAANPRCGAAACPWPRHAIVAGRSYVLTPSYVSAPQTVGQTRFTQTSLLPPFTALFFAADQ